MLIINKKYSNLLEGYRCAVELDKKLQEEWELEIKPTLLEKLKDRRSRADEKYNEEIKQWQSLENEKLLAWEKSTKEEIKKWQSEESQRRTVYEKKSKQIRQENEQKFTNQKNERIVWVFVLILSIIICPLTCLSLGIVVKEYIFGLFLLTCTSIPEICFFGVILFFFLKNIDTGLDPISTYIPISPPELKSRVINPKPTKQIFNEYEIEHCICPSVVEQWLAMIQYSENGYEYFGMAINENENIAFGIDGEKRMMEEVRRIDELESTENDSNYKKHGLYLPGLMIEWRNDVDGVYLSGKNLWILESKYYAGEIYYIDGSWHHRVRKIRNGNYEWCERDQEHQLKLDHQWLYEKDTITNSLLKKFPWVEGNIKGGLIFTHPNCELNIVDCPVPFTKLSDLHEMIGNETNNLDMTFEKRLEIVDELLASSRIHQKNEEVSAIKLADELYKNNVNYLSSKMDIES